MSYKGYLLDINHEIRLPLVDGENVIENGSYSNTREARNINSWTDAMGIDHVDNYRDEKRTIQFTIKERSIKQQSKLAALFAPNVNNNNFYIEYFDDVEGIYKGGYFHLDEVTFNLGTATNNKIYYDATTVTYREL